MSIRPPVRPVRAASVSRLPEPGSCRGGCRYEPKFDGWRAVAFVDRGEIFLQSRSGTPLHRHFPEVVGQLARLPPGTVIDGELVIWDAAAGRTSFVALQRRLAAGRRVADVADGWPAHLVCFDLLQAQGTVLLDEPLVRRRILLQATLTGAPAGLQLCPHTADRDVAEGWMAELPVTGVEGVVVKGAESRYRPGQAGWRKFRIYTSTQAVIAGLVGLATEPTALLLGRLDPSGQLRYVARSGRLGPAAQRTVAAGGLRPTTSHPWPQPLPASWAGSFGPGQPVAYIPVEPVTVAEIEVDSAAESGRWRHSVRFMRLRHDLTAADVPLTP